MSRLLLNLDKRMRVLEGSAGKEGLDADGEAMGGCGGWYGRRVLLCEEYLPCAQEAQPSFLS